MKTQHHEVYCTQVLIEKYSCGELSLILPLLMDIDCYLFCMCFCFSLFLTSCASVLQCTRATAKIMCQWDSKCSFLASNDIEGYCSGGSHEPLTTERLQKTWLLVALRTATLSKIAVGTVTWFTAGSHAAPIATAANEAYSIRDKSRGCLTLLHCHQIVCYPVPAPCVCVRHWMPVCTAVCARFYWLTLCGSRLWQQGMVIPVFLYILQHEICAARFVGTQRTDSVQHYAKSDFLPVNKR